MDQCNISVQDGYFATHGIAVEEFVTERSWDTLTIDGIPYHGAFKPNMTIRPSRTMYWSTDSSVTNKGWKICATDLSAKVLEDFPDAKPAVHGAAAALEGLQASKLRGRRLRNGNGHSQGKPIQGHAFAQESFEFMPEDFVDLEEDSQDEDEWEQDLKKTADEL